MSTVTTVLAGIGVFLLVPLVYRLLVFVYTYCPLIHDRAIDKYLWSSKPYALVTAASDGIGKAIAWELCERGFGVVLHGRNEEKLRKVKEEFEAKLNGKETDIRLVVFDAGVGKWEFGDLTKELEELDITVVAHVVGSSEVLSSSIDGQPESVLDSIMSRNLLFPLYLTRALLPSLRRTSQRGPVVIFALGSLASEVAPPYLSVYASSKKFLETLFRCLPADNRFTASLFPSRPKEDLRFKYIQVGSVNSATNKTPVSLTVPSTLAFARDCLRRVDAPGRVVCASLVHAVQLWAVNLIGERKTEEEAAREVRSMHGQALLAAAQKRE